MDTRVDAGSIIKQMEASINRDGFYMVKDGQTLLVRQLQKKADEIFMDFPDQDILFQSIDKDRNIPYVPFPEAEVFLEEGQEVFYGGFSKEKNTVECQTGSIDKIDENYSSFTVKGAPLSDFPAGPVFVHDRTLNAAVLAGIISPNQPKAYPISIFEGEERKGLIVQWGDYKGMENRKPGPGPRSITITGPATRLTYQLKYLDGNKILNPHSDRDYYGHENVLYLTALKEFVRLHNGGKSPVPAQFNFTCYKSSDYRAEQ